MFLKDFVRSSVNGLIVAFPTIVFLNTVGKLSLRGALLWTALAALLNFIIKIVRREPIVPAVAGLAIASLCSGVALVTGQARAFFLLPAIVLPVAIALACIVSICARRPLAGLLLNGMAGGPQQWWLNPRLRKFYANVTWVCFLVNGASGVLQRLFYMGNRLYLLGAVHIFIPLIFSAIIGATVFHAKRIMSQPTERNQR
jgi:hypothetical protein